MKLTDKRVLVTGGAGFVPSHVVDAFLPKSAAVTALDNFSAGKLSNLDGVKREIEIVDMDIRSERIAHVVKRHDLVIHMAANADVPVSVRDPEFDFQSNISGSFNVLKSCIDSNVEKVVFASSAAVYGEPLERVMNESHPTRPISPYGAAKLSVEHLGFAYESTFGTPFTALRIFNTYGVRQRRYVMYDLLKKLYKDSTKLEILGTGAQIRDYSYVTDTARCFLLAAEHDDANGEVYNVAGGNPISIRDLSRRLMTAMGLDEVEVTFTGSSWPGDIGVLAADISKARQELNFTPTVAIEEGVLLLEKWLREEEGRSR